MIHLIIDSTEFNRNPTRQNPAFVSIRRFASDGQIKVHLSEVTRREFITKRKGTLRGKVESAKSRLDDLSRESLPDEVNDFISGVKSKMGDVSSRIEAHSEGKFDEWLDEVNADVLEVDESHGQKVMENYFNGGKPFSEVKERSDIPDAFIWQAVIDFRDRREIDTFHFVSKDEGLRECVSEIDIAQTHKTLSGFVESDDFQDLVPPIRRKNADQLVHQLKSEGVWTTFDRERIRNEITYKFQGTELPREFGRSQQQPTTVVWVGDILSGNVEDAHYFSEGVFSAVISAVVEVELRYPLFESEYIQILEADDRSVSFDRMNDFNGVANEYIPMRIEMDIRFSCEPEELDAEELELSLEDLVDDRVAVFYEARVKGFEPNDG